MAVPRPHGGPRRSREPAPQLHGMGESSFLMTGTGGGRRARRVGEHLGLRSPGDDPALRGLRDSQEPSLPGTSSVDFRSSPAEWTRGGRLHRDISAALIPSGKRSGRVCWSSSANPESSGGSGAGARGRRGGLRLWGPGQGVGGQSPLVTSERGGAHQERWGLPGSGVETGPESLCLRSQVMETAPRHPKSHRDRAPEPELVRPAQDHRAEALVWAPPASLSPAPSELGRGTGPRSWATPPALNRAPRGSGSGPASSRGACH